MPDVTARSAKRPSLRAQHAENTRESLIRAARKEFTSRGYEAASLEAIVRRARVTKGALYHHYPEGKLGLFMAVFALLEAELVERVAISAAGAGTASWSQIDAALAAFVQHSAAPEYLQVVLHDGPRLIGMQAQREIDLSQASGLIEAMLQKLIDDREIAPQPVPVLARVFLGALTEGAQAIAQASDRERAIGEVHRVLWALLRGLRTPPE